MRKTLNLLQSLYLSETSNDITIEGLYKKIGSLSPQQITQILKILLEENFKKAHEKIFRIMSENHADVGTLVSKLTEKLQFLDFKNDSLKINLLKDMAKIEEKYQKIQDENLMLDNLIACFIDARQL